MNVLVAGTGSTTFGMFVDTSMRELAARAVRAALADASIDAAAVELVVVGNAAGGVLTGQEMIRAQTALSASPLAATPSLAVENACASASSAFHVACMAVASGAHDVVAVVGVEKMTHLDRSRAPRALATAVDIEAQPPSDGASVGPVFMEIYAAEARAYMRATGATVDDFAAVAAKATRNGSRNPIAQVRSASTTEEILAARTIVDPLTRPMCASIGDGAAALVLCSPEAAKRHRATGPRVLASALSSGGGDTGGIVERTAARAFEQASVGAADLDLVELHDAAAPAELVTAEQIGLVPLGDGPRLVRERMGEISGVIPINPSGGLLARGHAIGATGAAQLVELADQLRGRAGLRQVRGARLALAQNAGGWLDGQPAACCVTILSAP